mgnify:CR=1 FL=1
MCGSIGRDVPSRFQFLNLSVYKITEKRIASYCIFCYIKSKHLPAESPIAPPKMMALYFSIGVIVCPNLACRLSPVKV